MIILEKPYVSDFLIETIKNNNYNVLDNEVSRQYLPKEFLVAKNSAVDVAKNELAYSNSENSLDWIFDNLQGSKLVEMISLSKNKASFRNAIKSIFPDYFYKEVKYENLSEISASELKFPLILKPAIGFLSFGVFPVQNEQEWENVLEKLDLEIEKIKGVFPLNVVNTNTFIIEELIEGDEFAVDAYFDENSEATILNIFKHPFFDGKDVSDRAYYTSKSVISTHLTPFKTLLDNIGKVANYKNFPFHLELRYDGKNAVPIELNPMRFCGWCITDIAKNAWNINVYEAFLNKQKPDWDKILSESDDAIYYFTIGDIPTNISNANILDVDFDSYLKNISNPQTIRKIDFKNNPIWVIVFAKTYDINEIKNILSLNMHKYLITK